LDGVLEALMNLLYGCIVIFLVNHSALIDLFPEIPKTALQLPMFAIKYNFASYVTDHTAT